MLNLACDDSAASQLIGYIYTALISVLILSSMMLTSSTMINGNVSNTAQEEAEQVALYFQLAIEDLLNTIREHPTASPVVTMAWGPDSSNYHDILYKVNGTEDGLKVITYQPRGGSFEVNFPLYPATEIVTKTGLPIRSTTSYIVIYYDVDLKVVTLAAGN